MTIGARIAGILGCLALLALPPAALAQAKEVSEIKIVKTLGLASLPLMVIEANGLVEKHAVLLGLPKPKVSYLRLSNTMGINDALLSGNAHFAPNGPPSLLTIWSRTRGTSNEIMGVLNINEVEFWLNVNRPGLKSIRDLTDKDRIAVTAVKVGVPAILLQMAAEKEWGLANFNRLDKLTVSMSHTDALVALTSKSDLTGHFGAPPYSWQGAARPGIHNILKSSDVAGAFAGTLVMASSNFHKANPRTVKAFIKAVTEAVELIQRDKRAAAEVYLKLSGDKNNTLEDTIKQLGEPSLAYTTTPRGMMRFASFMERTGTLKPAPKSWKDLFFPEIHDLPGS